MDIRFEMREHAGSDEIGSKHLTQLLEPVLSSDSNFMSRPFHASGARNALYCDGVSLEALVRQYGTPLYVYSARQIAARLELFQHAFAGREHFVCYAVKANSSLAILKLLAGRGAGFDIVSGGELERVIVAAPEAVGPVVFSAVGKIGAEIDRALSAGILQFNLEGEAG